MESVVGRICGVAYYVIMKLKSRTIREEFTEFHIHLSAITSNLILPEESVIFGEEINLQVATNNLIRCNFLRVRFCFILKGLITLGFRFFRYIRVQNPVECVVVPQWPCGCPSCQKR